MRRPALAVACLLVAGCGGGSATAPQVTAPEPTGTAAIIPEPSPDDTAGSTGGVDGLAFPATTADGVLALAAQRPAGVASYRIDVAGDDTTAGVNYAVVVANDGARARIHQTQADGEAWVGLDIAAGTIAYVCRAPTGQSPACVDGDPDGAGARIADATARVLGSDFVLAVFQPIAAQTEGVGVAPDVQADVPVTCLATTGARLCVSRSGFITQLSAAGVTALADAVTTEVTPADLDRPAPQ